MGLVRPGWTGNVCRPALTFGAIWHKLAELGKTWLISPKPGACFECGFCPTGQGDVLPRLDASCLFQGSKVALQNLYLFHPSYPNVLLELNNSPDRIVAFDGKCCSLGPSSGDAGCGSWPFALSSLTEPAGSRLAAAL